VDGGRKNHVPTEDQQSHRHDFLAVELSSYDFPKADPLSALGQEEVPTQERANEDQLVEDLKGVEQYLVAEAYHGLT
jgi:hypothetical protein